MITPRVCRKLANARFLLFRYIAPNKHLVQFAEISAENPKIAEAQKENFPEWCKLLRRDNPIPPALDICRTDSSISCNPDIVRSVAVDLCGYILGALHSIPAHAAHNAPILHFKALFRRDRRVLVSGTTPYYTRLKSRGRHLKTQEGAFGAIPAQCIRA